MSNTKKPKKTTPHEMTVNLEEVAKALSKPSVSRNNKWKEIQKASMPPTAANYLPPPAPPGGPSLVDVFDIPVPESVATGLDTTMEDMAEDGYADVPSFQVPAIQKAMFKKSVQGSLFETPEPGNYPGNFNLPPNLAKKLFRAGELTMKTKEPERFEMVDTLEEPEVIPSNENDVDIIRQSLVIERVPERMRIIGIIIDTQNASGNDINMIKCNGDPLGCQAYDATHDCYYVNCAAYIDLGPIPVAYRIRSQGSVDNNNIIALPNEMIEKYLAPNQKKALKLFREKYPTPRFAMEYMQSITC